MSGRDLGQLMHDLAVAWRALSAYPPGHPNAVEALTRAHGTLASALRAGGDLELAAGRDGLLHGDDRYEAPTAARIAELLRRRGAAGVTIGTACDVRELELFLRALVADPRRAREAGSLAAEMTAAGVVGIVVHDLDFSGFRLIEGEGATALPEAGGLWERLVKRLIASGQLPAERWAAWKVGGGGAAELFAAILGLPGVTGGGSAAGQVADLAAGTGDAVLAAAAADYAERPDAETAGGIGLLWGSVAAPRRVRLAAALADAVEAAPGGATGGDVLLAGLPAAVEEAVRGALTALAATRDAEPASLDTSTILRLRSLFATGDLDAAAEVDTSKAVETILELPQGPDEVAVPETARRIADELGELPFARAAGAALVELALAADLEAAALPAVLERLVVAYRTLLAGGRLQTAAELAARIRRRIARGDDRAAAFQAALDRMANSDSVAALVAGLRQLPTDPVDASRELVTTLGSQAVRHLLLALAVEEDRGARHRLLELLASLGPVVARDASALLADPRWYVVRNALILLRRVGDPGSLPDVRRATAHPDLRVRLEAIRSLFAFEAAASRELLRAAILDPDPRLAAEAIELAGKHGITEAVDPLVELLAGWDLFGRRGALRLKAIQALGELGDGAALPKLDRFGARFPWPPVAIEERRTLYRTLGAYPPEARQRLVERGLRSRDGEIRRLSGRLGEVAP